LVSACDFEQRFYANVRGDDDVQASFSDSFRLNPVATCSHRSRSARASGGALSFPFANGFMNGDAWPKHGDARH